MASGFKIGQQIDGKVSTYILSKQLHKDIWTATYVTTMTLPPSSLPTYLPTYLPPLTLHKQESHAR